MSDSIQTPIYKIRKSIAVMDLNGNLIRKDIDINYLEDELVSTGYSTQRIKAHALNNTHEFCLLYKFWKTPVKWKDFIEEITAPGEEILKRDVSINEGFILFIANKKKKNIYAITGGFGHMEIQSFIDYQFGLDVLSRLIKADEKVLKSAKERNFVGGVLGSVKYFRGEYNLNENENFGNYYQELKSRLDKTVLKNTFKFKDSEIKKGGLCDAKSSFTIQKPVNLERAVEITDILDDISKQKSIDLNLIKKLDKSDKALIEKLDTQLDINLYKIFIHKPVDVNFEICHRLFDKYYEANNYKISVNYKRKKIDEVDLDECSNFNDIISVYQKHSISASDMTAFKTLIDKTNIFSYNEDIELTHGKLADHLCAEITFNGKSYFLFNQEWFLIKSDFQNILNTQCQEFINENSISGLLGKWPSSLKDENEFNATHIGVPDTLVFDKITAQNIEICDILKWNKKQIFFIHIKKGFNNEMRNLGRQVHISARSIVEDLKAGKPLLKKLYDRLKNMNATTAYSIAAKNQLSSLTKAEFLKLFDNRKPVFVISVLDGSNKGTRDFSDIKKFNSNIAKFCLQQLRQEMRLLGADLKILEIQK